MTTPQSVLSNIEYHMRTLCKMLEGDEDRADIMQRMNQIELHTIELIVSMQKQENLLNLIIKLLGKN